jgi:hypothetical protein
VDALHLKHCGPLALQDLSADQAGALARGLAELGVRRLGPRDVLQQHVLGRFEALALEAQQAQPLAQEQLLQEAVQLLAFCLLTSLIPGLLPGLQGGQLPRCLSCAFLVCALCWCWCWLCSLPESAAVMQRMTRR